MDYNRLQKLQSKFAILKNSTLDKIENDDQRTAMAEKIDTELSERIAGRLLESFDRSLKDDTKLDNLIIKILNASEEAINNPDVDLVKEVTIAIVESGASATQYEIAEIFTSSLNEVNDILYTAYIKNFPENKVTVETAIVASERMIEILSSPSQA
jgi:hypothetical protein